MSSWTFYETTWSPYAQEIGAFYTALSNEIIQRMLLNLFHCGETPNVRGKLRKTEKQTDIGILFVSRRGVYTEVKNPLCMNVK